MRCKIVFADAKVRKAFDDLKDSKTEDKELHNSMMAALSKIEDDAFCGIQLRKQLIPKEYAKRYGSLDNIWKYNLPGAWRLMYTIKRDDIIILGVILEWLDHKNYERRFGYKAR